MPSAAAPQIATGFPSPGWSALLTAPLRMRPNLLVIGAQKAGTTSLHSLLAGHPEIAMSRIKECNELVRERPSTMRHRAFLPLGGALAAKRARWAGESTPYYIFHPQAPVHAARLLPGVHAVAILRDPVARAWSHYRHAVRFGFEPLPFDEALAREAARLAEDPLAHRQHSYFARGCYAEQLERWFDALGRERVLVVSFEELCGAERIALKAIAGFLGLSTPITGELPLRNQGEGDPAGLSPALRDALRERYRPHNRRLEELLGRPFGWDA
ncbi:MAG: sulfotransferase family protein [Phycisphaerales bacterium]